MAFSCPHCGQRNRDDALICSNCAARLGTEPTATTAHAALAADRAASGATLPDTRVEPRVTLTPYASEWGAVQRRAAADASGESRIGWLAAAGAFFTVLLAGAGYWWVNGAGLPFQAPRAATAEQPTAPVTPESATPEAPAAAAPDAPSASVAPAPAPAPAPGSGSGSAADASPTAAAAPAPSPSRARRARREAEAEASTRAARETPSPAPERPRVRAAAHAPRPVDTPESTMPSSEPAWAPAAREATNTASPNYSDSGPPVVVGPGPRYQTAPTSPSTFASPPAPVPAPPPPSARAPRDPSALPMPAVTGGDPGTARTERAP